jgi:sarcosine oxidase
VQLAKEAYAAWSSVEKDADEQLVFKTGGLDIGPRDGAIPLAGYAEAMSAANVPFEQLEAKEIRNRWPAFTISDDIHALYQADGGIVAAERATAAHHRAARQLGATLRDNAPVTQLQSDGDTIEIEAGGERYRAKQLIIAAGPWTARALAHFDVKLPLEVTKEQAMYFKSRDLAHFEFGKFPVWIWMDDPSFYGFPVFGEPGAIKATQDAGGLPVDADTRTFEEDPAITARVTSFLERYLPGACGPPHVIKTCLYTLTPDRDFVIDTIPNHPNVSVAVGAGHAFKFASVIGRILSDLAIDAGTKSGIDDFRIDRPILTMEAPPKSYMV